MVWFIIACVVYVNVTCSLTQLLGFCVVIYLIIGSGLKAWSDWFNRNQFAAISLQDFLVSSLPMLYCRCSLNNKLCFVFFSFYPQAFIEMQNLAEATAMVNFNNHSVANIRGKQVFVQYSKHTELKTDQAHPHKVRQVSHSALNGYPSMPYSSPSMQLCKEKDLDIGCYNYVGVVDCRQTTKLQILDQNHHSFSSKPNLWCY